MTIDFRSDTVTRPTDAMRQVMLAAPVGDDVYGEDPTVNRLQALAAEMTGKEAALFCPTGTQANVLAQLSQCQRGDEYIAGNDAHCYKYEAGSASVLGGIQAQTLLFEANGTLDLTGVKKLIKADDEHFAKTRLLCIENTTSGKALPMQYINSITAFKKETGLNAHLDGARVCNAVVAHSTDLVSMAAPFDSISFCLSKGLGAPVGSMLCASTEIIATAHRYRKMLGGGMRQSGIIAAAGIYALENNIKRLAEDHQKAQELADALGKMEEIEIVSRDTNMCFARIRTGNGKDFIKHMKNKNILVTPMYENSDCLRLVTHLDISAQDIETFLKISKEFFLKSTVTV